ncbi:MAG: integrase arm-type DNA-binding domain-containing protein [Gammaproteobacteria bacterium]|nr:integrase arm-type DNA-binding domain-containing protein [Gammaproteobacteria bacterium]MDE0282366.1 integrase arm-type DNA-binding domain-containing protein [Gammaproteobacteria bacterium]
MKVGRDTVFWDRNRPGFGVRIFPSGTKMYIAQARYGGKSVRVTLGRHGVITADEARSQASRVINRIRDSTAASLRKLIDGHILPVFGKPPLLVVGRKDVAAFHAHRIHIPSAANRTVTLIAHMYAKAADCWWWAAAWKAPRTRTIPAIPTCRRT